MTPCSFGKASSPWVWLGLLLIGSVGCGGTYDAEVVGKVLLDEQPINRGTVVYIPVQQGPQAYGRIDEDGSYSMRTGREDGLPPGEYAVTVVASEPAPSDWKGQGPPPSGPLITPPWYRSKKTSPLKFTVEPGSNEINLELTSEPPPDWVEPKKRRRRR